MSSVRCLFFVVRCMSFVVCCVVRVECCLRFGVLVFVVCGLSCAVRWLSSGVICLLSAAWWCMLFIAC